jgi:DNA-binding NarL/FixJ family response regulator
VEDVSAVRVIIADDHALTRLGVRAALEGQGFELVGEAGDATEAVAVAVREHPDVALLDIHMPGDGIKAARRIATAVPTAAVVMLTVSAADEDLLDAFRAGAVGYLPKDMDFSRLPDALRGVLSGQAAVPREYMARVLHHLRETGRTARIPIRGHLGVTFTSREAEVAQLLRERLTTVQMAERLFVSQATVRSHIGAILRKLGVQSRDEAVGLLEGER